MAIGAFAEGPAGAGYSGRVTSFVVLSCIVAGSGGILFGYDLGISGGVTSMESFLSKFFPDVYHQMKGDKNVSNYCRFDSELLTVFTSSLYVAGLVATLFASSVTRRFGRRASILIGGTVFIVGSVFGGAAVNVYMLLLNRILLGIGLGFTNQVSIEYGLSEMMNTQAMGGIVGKVAPGVSKWFPDLPELEAIFPAGTIDHSSEPIYPGVPKWEESILEARSRYASVIKALADKYPHENLLLVTHGEGVGASVSYFEMGLEIYDVEYCAYSVLERKVSMKPGDEQGAFTADSFKVLTKSGTTGIQYAPVSESWFVG